MITYKEEFVGCEKYCRAYELGGGDAIMMWGALKRYAAKHPDNAGFVPDEDIDRLIGAPRNPRQALDALVRCGRLLRDGTRGAGLVETADSGWQLHDYLDHANAPEDEELRRERDRVRKQRQREEKRLELARLREQSRVPMLVEGEGVVPPLSQGQVGHVPGQAGHVPAGVPGSVPGVVLAGARPPAPARTCAPTRVGARPQPNPTQPNPLSLPEERKVDSKDPAPEPELPPAAARGEPRPEPVPAPARSERRWRSFPKGWRGWSIQTSGEAVAQGLSTADLAGHVDYWTLRDFPGGPVNDLDGELRRAIAGIVARKRKAAAATGAAPPGASPATPDATPHRWAPTAEHRAFAKKHDRNLQDAVNPYRAAGMPERIGTTWRIDEDFMHRLRWWVEHGGDFPATGKRSRFEAAREPARAVGA